MLYIVATPIGHLEDITLRALRVLGEVDFILAEDTRKTSSLLNRYGLKTKLVSFFEHNEVVKAAWVVQELKKGKIGDYVMFPETLANGFRDRFCICL